MSVVVKAPADPREIEDYLWRDFTGECGWDVGANCGQSIAIMRDRFRQVISFEPCAESFDVAARTYPDADIRRLAVSDHDGVVVLAAIPSQMESGQLVSPGTHGMEWDPGNWDEAVCRALPCRSVDSLVAEIGAPDFIKADTEGHEGHILAGAAGLLKIARTAWLIEFHAPELHDQCVSQLEACGYLTETVRHPHYPQGSAMWHQHGWIKAYPPSRSEGDGLWPGTTVSISPARARSSTWTGGRSTSRPA